MNTEEQQIEQLKAFWNEHGKGIVAGLVIGFAIFYGWRYYDAQVRAEREAASVQFEQVVAALFSGNDDDLTAAQDFVNNNTSAYSQLAAFQLAKAAIDANDYGTAVSALQTIRDTAEPELAALAALRQARVLLAQEQYEAALAATNAAIQVSAFAAIAYELQGDILLAKGDYSGARQAYLTAQVHGAEGLAELKLNSIVAGS